MPSLQHRQINKMDASVQINKMDAKVLINKMGSNVLINKMDAKVLIKQDGSQCSDKQDGCQVLIIYAITATLRDTSAILRFTIHLLLRTRGVADQVI